MRRAVPARASTSLAAAAARAPARSSFSTDATPLRRARGSTCAGTTTRTRRTTATAQTRRAVRSTSTRRSRSTKPARSAPTSTRSAGIATNPQRCHDRRKQRGNLESRGRLVPVSAKKSVDVGGRGRRRRVSATHGSCFSRPGCVHSALTNRYVPDPVLGDASANKRVIRAPFLLEGAKEIAQCPCKRGPRGRRSPSLASRLIRFPRVEPTRIRCSGRRRVPQSAE
jgi:hypothetical protein